MTAPTLPRRTVNGRTFDFVQRHVDANRSYGVAEEVPDVPTKAVFHQPSKVVLDQFAEGACVGGGTVHEYGSSPFRGRIHNELMFEVYRRAKEIDEWEGVDYEGTSVRAGMLVGRERGWWDGFRWCFSMDDVKRALTIGPVVIGVNWYEGMYATGRDGVVSISGRLVGGHCILVNGWSPKFGRLNRAPEVYRWRNSWGKTYGINGQGYILATDLKRLLIDERGEAAVAVGRRLAAA